MKTSCLSVDEIIAQIEAGALFEAKTTDGSIKIKINKYVPFCCTAIHAGSRFREELKDKIAIDDYERWYEEDPHTQDFIASLPITLVGNDSRYEYDLNRAPEECIYETAWGKKVWKRKLSPKEIRLSKEKHANYYKITHALLLKLEKMFGGCIVYDIHSYNYRRWEKNVPLFNIGIERIDKEKYKADIDKWITELSAIDLPNIENTVATNEVFWGRGYNLEYITSNFPNSLVLATEIKKVYCDELTGDAYPLIIRQLQHKLKLAILNSANSFGQKQEGWHHYTTAKLLDKNLDSSLLDIDRKLYSLLKNFELLATVNPVNSEAEKKRFFRNKCTSIPQFKYAQVKLNAYQLKQQLFSLPVQSIQDVSIRTLYESVINSFFDKIDMISSLGKSKFLYNSLRYFGRPSSKDMKNANYLLHLPDIPGEAQHEPYLDVHGSVAVFRKALDDYGIKAKIEISNKIISQVMVLNSKRSIVFNANAKFRKKELSALIEHEIGVHMVTTINSNQQRLKIFNLGLPLNTLTQEGLAILAEYQSGYLTLNRLKRLALRAVAVDALCNGADFIECYNLLMQYTNSDKELSFSISTRVYRGGGFTKDYLYLSGFVKIFKFWQNHNDLSPLLIGKTSLEFYRLIEEMIGREMISQPNYQTACFSNPASENSNPVYDYIISGLK